MSLGPTHLLAIAVALFFAPAVYMLSVSLLEAQGALGSVGATLSPAAETALWMAAIVALIGPLSFPKILQGATRTNRLIVASSCSVAGSGIGTVLAILGAGTRPTLILGAAAMLAILGWSVVYRDCFESDAPFVPRARYTGVLVATGVLCLASMGMRILAWRTVDEIPEPAVFYFMSFIETTAALAALGVARLRRNRSRLARPATQVLSWALLLNLPFGTLAAIYWLIAVRRRELTTPPPGGPPTGTPLAPASPPRPARSRA